jgi:leader peptidase (prepilin peptidase) / N-methyltransferase
VIALVTCAVVGAVLGSFVAVVLDRVPRGMSIVTPPPHCAACGTVLRPWDNLPVVAWLALRGRCRYCAAFIPLQFFVLEVLGGAAGIAVALLFVR